MLFNCRSTVGSHRLGNVEVRCCFGVVKIVWLELTTPMRVPKVTETKSDLAVVGNEEWLRVTRLHLRTGAPRW